eukprot:5424662-Pyramimonas_sp.AAC.1
MADAEAPKVDDLKEFPEFPGEKMSKAEFKRRIKALEKEKKMAEKEKAKAEKAAADAAAKEAKAPPKERLAIIFARSSGFGPPEPGGQKSRTARSRDNR